VAPVKRRTRGDSRERDVIGANADYGIPGLGNPSQPIQPLAPSPPQGAQRRTRIDFLIASTDGPLPLGAIFWSLAGLMSSMPSSGAHAVARPPPWPLRSEAHSHGIGSAYLFSGRYTTIVDRTIDPSLRNTRPRREHRCLQSRYSLNPENWLAFY